MLSKRIVLADANCSQYGRTGVGPDQASSRHSCSSASDLQHDPRHHSWHLSSQRRSVVQWRLLGA